MLRFQFILERNCKYNNKKSRKVMREKIYKKVVRESLKKGAQKVLQF